MTLIEHDLTSFGELLKAFRKRRRLTQQQLAEAIGRHRSAIIRWEQGSFLPESKALVLELARHLHLDDQESHHFLEASLTALPPHWLVPLPRNPFFTGREQILEMLHTRLDTSQAASSYAVHGPGGVGKTQLAIEYACRYALEYSAVFWIEAETCERIIASLMRLAEYLQVPEKTNGNQLDMLAAARHWLVTHRQWLLILDNLGDPEWLNDLLPFAHQGNLLITTRCAALGPLASGMELFPMEQEEGVQLLLRRAKVLEPAATRMQLRQFALHSPTDYAAAKKVVRVLGGLPLALDQAGAYLEETGCSLVNYLWHYRQRRPYLLERRGTSAGLHPQSVAATFKLAIEQARVEQLATLDVLQVCAFLQTESIPEELFLVGAVYLGPALTCLADDPTRFDQIIASLRRLSLIQRHAETRTLSLHRLVQAVLLDAMTEKERKQWSRRVSEALNAVFPNVQSALEHAAWVQCERLLPHILFFFRQAQGTREAPAAASLAHKIVRYLRERGHL